MEPITIAEIISATGGKLLSGDTNNAVESVCIDSRKTEKNALFIPLVGENQDGHDFIKKAFELGACATLTEKNYDQNEIYGATIKVESTKKALGDLAKYYKSKFKIPVVGVTGSVGKTTTKEIIASVLSQSMNVLKTQGNYNGQLGLPLTIFNLNSKHEIAIFEMGISKFGEMDRLAEIADVDIAVITNIGLSHVENFKSIENTCNEKMKIINKESGIFYLNGDSPLLFEVKNKENKNIVYFGLNGNYAYRCEDVYSNNNTTYFTLVTDDFKEAMELPCLGIHNVYNALAAIAIAQRLGMHIEDIKQGLLNFKNIAMRQQILKLENAVTLIDDSYNASPDSVRSSVGVLKNLESSGKNIVVMADMLELGKDSPKIHFDIGKYIALENVDVLITIGEMAKFMADGAKSFSKEITTIHCSNNQDAFQKLKNILSEGDKILVKGSRGMRTDEIVKMLMV